jgi:rubrerythrin
MQLSAKAVVGYALQIETNGEGFYREVAKTCANKEAKALFADLAEQEERHFRTFARLLAQTPDVDVATEDQDGYREYLRHALAGALVGGPDKGLALARKASGEAEALAAALAFEKDTLLFFYEVRAWVSGDQRAIVEDVIAEEKTHVRMLARMIADQPWVS